jgi:hypothetical protein
VSHLDAITQMPGSTVAIVVLARLAVSCFTDRSNAASRQGVLRVRDEADNPPCFNIGHDVKKLVALVDTLRLGQYAPISP